MIVSPPTTKASKPIAKQTQKIGKRFWDMGVKIWKWHKGLSKTLKVVAMCALAIIFLAGITIFSFILTGNIGVGESKFNLTSWIGISIFILAIIGFSISAVFQGGGLGMKFKLPSSTSFGWLFAILGLAFAYFLLNRIAPDFWSRWSEIAGFWWIPVGLVVGFLLLSVKEGKAATVGGVIVTIAVLAITITSCDSMWSIHKEKVKAKAVQKEPSATRTTNPTRNWPPVIEKKESVIAWVDKWSETKSLPFGKGFFLQLEGGTIFGKKNDLPLKDSYGSLLVINQENQVDAFGYNCQKVAFKSATNKPVVVIIYYYDALVYK